MRGETRAARELARAVGGEVVPRRALRTESFDAVLNTTPVGMYPHDEISPLSLRELHCRIVMDLIYRPERTRLLKLAASKGIATVSGVEMFLAQGIAQWEMWTEQRAPEAVMRRAVLSALRAEARSKVDAAAEAAVIQPDFREFQRLAKQGNLIPVFDVLPADLLTPVSAYLRIAQGARYSFLLESVEGGEKIARYTFAGANPEEVFRYANGACVMEGRDRVVWEERDPVAFLRTRIERFRPVRLPGLPPLVAGAIGYFSYDMVRLIERLPKRLRDDIGLFDAMLMFYHGIIAFDHVQHRLWIVRNVFTEGSGSLRAKYNAAVREIRETRKLLEQPVAAEKPRREARAGKRSPLKVTSNFRRSEYLAAVRKCKEYIRAGDIFQVVVSQRFSAKTKAAAFRHLSRASRPESISLSFLSADERRRRRRQLPGNARQGPGTRRLLPAHRGNAAARQGRSRRPAPRKANARQRKRARRTHHARRSRPQRSRHASASTAP